MVTNSKEKQREYSRLYRDKYPKEYIEYLKQWRLKHREQYLDCHNKYQKTYRKNHREIIKAQQITQRILIDSKCSSCGSIENLERHHIDYSRPLEVVTLCLKCHVLTHKLYRRNEFS